MISKLLQSIRSERRSINIPGVLLYFSNRKPEEKKNITLQPKQVPVLRKAKTGY